MQNKATILEWTEVSRVEYYKPTWRDKLLNWLRLLSLPVPKYYISAKIKVESPCSLRPGDIFITEASENFYVMFKDKEVLPNDSFLVTSMFPIANPYDYSGKFTIYIISQVYNERDPNTMPYGNI